MLLKNRKLVSIVTPAYNEAENIPELARRLREVFEVDAAYDFEVIIVENGSADDTWDRIRAESEIDTRFKGLRLSRNFGADGGITAGLARARGDAAVIMCADLQDPPEMIATFISYWEQGYENVYGVVTKRVGASAVRRVNSQIFYWLINRLTGGSFPKNASDFRLVDRRVYETVNAMRERNRFMRGMFFWSGFKSIGIEHERPARFAGESKASTRHVVALALKGILSFSYAPLRLITYIGLALSALSFLLLVWVIIRVFTQGVPFAGYGTLVSVTLLMFGVMFTMLGVVAEYVGLIYDEVKQRPSYIVKDDIGLS